MENLELKVAKEVKKEEVENLVQETGKVTNEKIEESLNYDLLSQEEKDAIEEFNKKINIEDSTQILQYGAKAQNKISQFSDSVLEGVKTKSAGEVGELLADLVAEIKTFDSDIANDNPKLNTDCNAIVANLVAANLTLVINNCLLKVDNFELNPSTLPPVAFIDACCSFSLVICV